MQHFMCPYCKKQLSNQNTWYPNENENEFWCDDCDKIYIIEEDGSYIEEEA